MAVRTRQLRRGVVLSTGNLGKQTAQVEAGKAGEAEEAGETWG